MGLLDGLKNLKDNLSAMSRGAAEDALTAGLNLAAKMKSRVQQEGLDSEESPFEDYTPDYAKQRVKAGYQAEQVDFTRTGSLMASVLPYVTDVTDTSVTVEIGSGTEEGKAILRGQARKRGVIIANTEQELRESLEEFAQRQVKRLDP